MAGKPTRFVSVLGAIQRSHLYRTVMSSYAVHRANEGDTSSMRVREGPNVRLVLVSKQGARAAGVVP